MAKAVFGIAKNETRRWYHLFIESCWLFDTAVSVLYPEEWGNGVFPTSNILLRLPSAREQALLAVPFSAYL